MTTQKFIMIEKERKYSRTYGGSNYTLAMYEVLNKELKYIGEVKGCTMSHKGETSEAFTALQKLNAIKKSILKKIDKGERNDLVYYGYNYRDTAGLYIDTL